MRQQDRAHDGHYHEDDLDKIENEAEQEDHHHHHQHSAYGAAGQPVEKRVYQLFTTKTPEHEGEHCGADQDHKHHASHFQGALHGFPEACEV